MKTCPVLGCKEPVRVDHFACHEHWYELPPNLRSKMYHAYVYRVKTGNTDRHIGAVQQCFEWYRQQGHGIQ